MNITLRKAAALQNTINETVKGIDFQTQISVNEFHDPEAEIFKAATQVCDDLVRRENLLSALYEIRKAVGSANAQTGIDTRLADVALLEKQIQFYSTLANTRVREAHTVIAGRLDKIRNDKSERRLFGYNDSLTTTIFSQEDLVEFRQKVKEFKKFKQTLQDQILELNVRTEIALSESAEIALKAEGLL